MLLAEIIFMMMAIIIQIQHEPKPLVVCISRWVVQFNWKEIVMEKAAPISNYKSPSRDESVPRLAEMILYYTFTTFIFVFIALKYCISSRWLLAWHTSHIPVTHVALIDPCYHPPIPTKFKQRRKQFQTSPKKHIMSGSRSYLVYFASFTFQ